MRRRGLGLLGALALLAWLTSALGAEPEATPIARRDLRVVKGTPRPKPTPVPSPTATPPTASRPPAAFSGPEVYRSLAGRCFETTAGNYRYFFCPFANITQLDIGTKWGAPFWGLLGTWDRWTFRSEGQFYDMQLYTDGTACGWNNPRKTHVVFECTSADLPALHPELLPHNRRPSATTSAGSSPSPAATTNVAQSSAPDAPTEVLVRADASLEAVEAERRAALNDDAAASGDLVLESPPPSPSVLVPVEEDAIEVVATSAVATTVAAAAVEGGSTPSIPLFGPEYYKLVSVEEPSTCSYRAVFRCPEACFADLFATPTATPAPSATATPSATTAEAAVTAAAATEAASSSASSLAASAESADVVSWESVRAWFRQQVEQASDGSSGVATGTGVSGLTRAQEEELDAGLARILQARMVELARTLTAGKGQSGEEGPSTVLSRLQAASSAHTALREAARLARPRDA